MKLRTYRSKSSATRKGNRVYRKQETDSSRNGNSPVDYIMFLQRTIGNKAVQRLLKEVGSQQSAVGGHVQAKLRIGQPNDIYEQEADRVAEQVMRMPENTGVSGQVSGVRKGDESVQTKSAFPSSCSSCKEEELIQPKHLPIKITPLVQRQAEDEELRRQPIKEEEETLQVKGISGQTTEATPGIESRLNSIKGGGHPLPESMRAYYDSRFGYDFSHVRVHTDTQAAESASELNAQAFTIGRNVVFGAGQYKPETSEGRRLFAHELAHVLQQSVIAQRETVMRSPDKKGFDEKKMFEIARKSKKVVELEEKAKKLGFSYAGQVSGEHSYTDPDGKKIYIQKELTNEKAALSYAYELQNAVNVATKYKDIFDKAEKGKFKDASEYATAMLSVEVEAMITRAEVSIELGVETWKAVEELVKKYKKGEIKLDELKKSVLKLAETGVIDGMNARKYL